MKSLSKKKLQDKISKLNAKLKSKNEDKSKIRFKMKQTESDRAYWEDRASMAEEVLKGDY